LSFRKAKKDHDPEVPGSLESIIPLCDSPEFGMQSYQPGVEEFLAKERHDTPQMIPNGLCQFEKFGNLEWRTQVHPMQKELSCP